ncbi:hypothetical protein ACR9VJ_26555 [Streptomyces sp. H49]|uniref:hypothetical protein n=1 Tax=Streptomyces sp. H49 TaxID=3444117 RepID=UPI003F4AC276
MAIYQGPAVLVMDDGAEFTVGADLRSKLAGHESWGGRLLVQGDHWDDLKNKVSGYRLRLPSGQEGEFVRIQTDDRPRTLGSPFFYNILGSGDAPF